MLTNAELEATIARLSAVKGEGTSMVSIAIPANTCPTLTGTLIKTEASLAVNIKCRL